MNQSCQEFERRISEADAYLQMMIDQIKVIQLGFLSDLIFYGKNSFSKGIRTKNAPTKNGRQRKIPANRRYGQRHARIGQTFDCFITNDESEDLFIFFIVVEHFGPNFESFLSFLVQNFGELCSEK